MMKELRRTWPFWLGVAGLFLFTAWLFGMLAHIPAQAHGDADWIMRGDHAWCCSERDCAMLPAEWTSAPF